MKGDSREQKGNSGGKKTEKKGNAVLKYIWSFHHLLKLIRRFTMPEVDYTRPVQNWKH